MFKKFEKLVLINDNNDNDNNTGKVIRIHVVWLNLSIAMENHRSLNTRKSPISVKRKCFEKTTSKFINVIIEILVVELEYKI